MNPILLTTLVLGAIGLLCGILLAVIAKKFAVPENPLVAQLLNILPGANCGGCGRPGCDGYARDIAEQGAPLNLCTACTAEMITAMEAITGRTAGTAAERKVAFVHCAGDAATAPRRFSYNGMAECSAVQAVAGGDKACTYGCLGYGTCERACSFHAISIQNGVAVVDFSRCTGCGACVNVCPRKVISLIRASAPLRVACSSKDKGPIVRKACSKGCVGCGICTKLAPNSFTVEANLASINDEAPIEAATADTLAHKCPGHCIQVIPRS